MEAGERSFGFTLAFFKRSCTHHRVAGVLPLRWFSPFCYFAHLTLSDIQGRAFYFCQRLSGDGIRPPASMATDRHAVSFGGWHALEVGRRHQLWAAAGGLCLWAHLVPVKPTLHFAQNSILSHEEGDSHCLSIPRLEGAAHLVLGGSDFSGRCTAWMDHEYGCWRLVPWDWLGLQLDNGWELMVYARRRAEDPSHEAEWLIVDPVGRARPLDGRACRLSALGSWTSPRTGLIYSPRWRVEVPELRTELSIEPVLPCQEMDARRTTGTAYWEGAVDVAGRFHDQPIGGHGFAESIGQMINPRCIPWRLLLGNLRCLGGQAGDPPLEVRTA
jgi:predicted secreted hydrolase